MWSNDLIKSQKDPIILKVFEDFRRRLKFAEGSKTPKDLVKAFQNSDLII